MHSLGGTWNFLMLHLVAQIKTTRPYWATICEIEYANKKGLIKTSLAK
jgi:hypothetical protein